ncbi:hypothetical protein GXM_00962 [Nostoc sphaeroides CCNUC1]|uniref:Uncharacterized protein n=1 Tax=Nostoc sphaeroides CCNUC1 TaxID=2653204 RepID=A0A5P8VUA3_9NOSO|nr:hypothetical protein GXM_00962 [Nostoc sphaeroides CCNUC1]
MVVLVILANVCVCNTFLGSKNYDDFWNFSVLRIEMQNVG